jgi:hypothetical protein
VYLPWVNCTIRWQRGDTIAYIFEGKRTETHSDEGGAVLATIPVSSTGWTDLADVKLAGKIGTKQNINAARRAGCIHDHSVPVAIIDTFRAPARFLPEWYCTWRRRHWLVAVPPPSVPQTDSGHADVQCPYCFSCSGPSSPAVTT